MAMRFLDFERKWVVITGASAGIGRATAIELSRRNARLVLMGRDPDRLAETVRHVEAEAEAAAEAPLTRVLDLTEHSRILPLVMEIREETGPIYGLFHCAGAIKTRPMHANTEDVVRFHLDIHVVAALEMARAICRRDVLEEDGGSVLFASSIYGRVGMPGQMSYCASKGAIAAAVRALAVELARRGIRVNSISPGLVMTEMAEEALSVLSDEHVAALKDAHPLGVGKAEDVARAAAFLLAPQSRWITGADLVIDGGFTAR